MEMRTFKPDIPQGGKDPNKERGGQPGTQRDPSKTGL